MCLRFAWNTFHLECELTIPSKLVNHPALALWGFGFRLFHAYPHYFCGFFLNSFLVHQEYLISNCCKRCRLTECFVSAVIGSCFSRKTLIPVFSRAETHLGFELLMMMMRSELFDFFAYSRRLSQSHTRGIIRDASRY